MSTNNSNPISEAQHAANIANAQHSTGPRSATGKATVALNAVKTGLTGCTVVLPNEDGQLYRAHIAAYEMEFQPEGIQEFELVQSLADIRWRLNRIPGLEAALNTCARATLAGRYADYPEQHQDFFLTVEVYDRNEKKLHNIHLHENRLARRRERELAELRVLQQERKAKEAQAKKEEAEKAAAATTKAAPAKTATATQNGFVFNNPPAASETPSTAASKSPEITQKAAA